MTKMLLTLHTKVAYHHVSLGMNGMLVVAQNIFNSRSFITPYYNISKTYILLYELYNIYYFDGSTILSGKLFAMLLYIFG